MKDANGLEIGPERACPLCKTMVATRPDGSIRSHSRFRSDLHPGLGVEACPGGAKPSTTCPSCEVENSVTWQREKETFPYGMGANAVDLTAIIDKGRCAACTFEFTDWRAEIARDEVVQRWLSNPS